MAINDTFTPRLGKIRDTGAAGGARLRKRLKTTAKKLARARKSSKFTGKRLGRGKASACHAHYHAHQYASERMRRVVVKTHIAKPGKVVGGGAFSKHLNYLQRDGVERDGSGGALYSRDGQIVDADAFAARSQKDRHQFRFIVSPEDAEALGDLKSYTQELMEIMERDLGTRLDWVAVDHHNTSKSHTHIVVRGKDAARRDLIIAPDYWSRGFRQRASILATQRLGPRRALEIMRQQKREIDRDRFTGIDRQLFELEQGGEIAIGRPGDTKGRFTRDLQVQRLKHLQTLRLAVLQSPLTWRMADHWTNTLKTLGQRGDIIKAIAAGIEPGDVPEAVRFINEQPSAAPPLVGTVYRHGPSDELRDTRFILVRDFDGNTWHAEAGLLKDGPLPPRGAIVELSRASSHARQSDRTIAQIAEQSGGYYSDEIHHRFDPSSSSAYRLVHKRRLEKLRRAGIVSRLKDGRWQIESRFLDRAVQYEAEHQSVKIETRSWIPLKQQIKAVGETWLDGQGLPNLAKRSNRSIYDAKRARMTFLRERGLLGSDRDTLSKAAIDKMNAEEMKSAKTRLVKQTSLKDAGLSNGSSFEGRFEKTVDLGQGRFAIVQNEKSFALVPWRREMDAYRGRDMIVEARQRGVTWTLPSRRSRGISR